MKLFKRRKKCEDPSAISLVPIDTDRGRWRITKVLVCPDCGNHEFLTGPSGGLSINIQCSACRSLFNYMRGLNILERIN